MSESKSNIRKIIHVDMDAFYASIEQRDNPEYRGKAIAVGGSPTGRGVVATASYEARKFGVRSAMTSKKALELCPQIIFVYPRFDAYKAASKSIRTIFQRYTDLIEPLSLDEAFLDVTDDKLGIGSALDIAREIKEAIKTELNLTASAGVSVNKFVAKIASDLQKPDGLTFIGPSKIESFIAQLPIEKFFGVGKVTAEKMKKLHVFNGADLKRLSEQELVHHFGKSGRFYYQIVRGIDNRPVVTDRAAKSVGAEDTFETDLVTKLQWQAELQRIAQTVSKRLQNKQLLGRTITLKIKYSDFKQVTRSISLLKPTNEVETIIRMVFDLLEKVDTDNKAIRLLGISLSNFDQPLSYLSYQLELFD